MEGASTNQPSCIYNLVSIVEQLDFLKMFPEVRPIEVELGSGDGSFLAAYAQSRPETNFVGVERLLGRLRKLDRKGLRLALANLRLVRIEASYFVEFLLPHESVTAFHIYFPDPWPKRRHHKHRLVNPKFADSLKRALLPGGKVFLRTDDTDYFSQMTKVFGENDAFSEDCAPVELEGRLTDFEREFQARGIPTLRAAYRR